MAFDFEELQRRKRPATAECRIALDSEVIDTHARALAAYDAAKAVADEHPGPASKAALADAEDALETAEAAAAEATVTFKFKGLSEEDWDALVGEHPATSDQVRKARRDATSVPTWNEDTFPCALVAACCVEPEMTVEQVEQMWKSPDWNAAELQGLFSAAYSASRTRRVPELGKGFGRTPS
jgi:hypothetical protein